MTKGGKLLSAEQSTRLALLDSAARQQVIEMIVRGLQSAERISGESSPDGLWALLNGVQPMWSSLGAKANAEQRA